MLHFQTLTTQWNLDFSNFQEIGSKNRRVRETGVKLIKCFTKERTFGSSYQEFQKIEGSRNRDFTVAFTSLDEFEWT